MSSAVVVALLALALACCAVDAQQNNEVVCEKSAFTLECPESQAIDILDAQYGRTSAQPDCGRGPESLTDTDCQSRNALIDLESRCNGKTMCELPDDLNEVFGDPCSNTVKYANISWGCISEDMPPVDPDTGNFKRSACERTPLIVECPENQKINIVSSNYGRLPDTEDCGQAEESLGSTSCSAPAAIDFIAGLCQGQNACNIDEVSSDTLGSEDPCPGTFKVVEVEYNCVDADDGGDDESGPSTGGERTQVCEKQVASIRCPEGTFVDLTSATFGRNSQSPSCGKSGASIADTECGDKDNVLEFMERFCDGSTECAADVSTKFFPGGDPCPGIRKFLDFEYNCTDEMVAQPSDLPIPVPSVTAAPVESPTDLATDPAASVTDAAPTSSSSSADTDTANGEDTDDEDASVCFPGDATVELADGSLRFMADLTVNDAIRTGDSSFHPVFFFSHRAAKTVARFVEVSAAGKTVRLSPSHYMATPKGLVSAGAVRVGQEITHQEAGLVVVEKVERVQARGLYAPHTSGSTATLFVDGFKVSEFTTAVHPVIAHGLLSPLKWLHRMTGLSVSGILNTNAHSLSKLLPSGPSEV